MSNKRLIDGEKLLEWLMKEINEASKEWSAAYMHFSNLLGYGFFDIPDQGEELQLYAAKLLTSENDRNWWRDHAKTLTEIGSSYKGEAAILREALEKVISLIDREAFRTAQNVASEALSSHTGIQKDGGDT